MKLKVCFRLGLTAAIILIVCQLTTGQPVSASFAAMKWLVVETPDSTGNVIKTPSEINTIAIGGDGRTFYALDIPDSKVYKSTNWGITWDDITGRLTSAGAAMPAWSIAVAPDNPNFVAVVTSVAGTPRNVFISSDGGTNWQDTDCPAANNIGAIDLSRNYGNYDVAIGTRTASGTGEIYIFRSSGYSSWAAQGFAGDILSVKFSPNYGSDAAIAIIYTDTTGTYFNVGIHDLNAKTTDWTAIYGATPPEVAVDGSGTSAKVNQVITADLELPADFSGQAPSSCRCYISIDAPTANAGIYRIDHTRVHQLMAATTSKRIASIAYFGTYTSGKLLAGEVLGNSGTATVPIWFTDTPNTCPSTCWYLTQKPPSGAGNSGYGNAHVVWSPDGNRAYCATSSALLNNPANWPTGYLTSVPYDESAFSITRDKGQTWNQLSLIDTEMSFLSDVAITPTSDTIYLASVNNHAGSNNFDSIWRGSNQSSGILWERVLCLSSTSNDIILRTSNIANDRAVFFASRLTGDLRQSLDDGQTWSKLTPNSNITDFAVSISNDTRQLYVLDNNYVHKGTGNLQTWKWSETIDTTLTTGHSITISPQGVVLVGDATQGLVAYSPDGGTQFIQLPAVPTPGEMHAISDHRIMNHIVVYAASSGAGGKIYAFVVGATPGWIDMNPPEHSFYGLVQVGTLYGAWTTSSATGVNRTINPESMDPNFVLWDTLSVGSHNGVVFTGEPSSLKASHNVILWAIDDRPYTSATGRLWAFYDCFTVAPSMVSPPSREVLFSPPTPTSPAKDTVISIYVDTGKIAAVDFKWHHSTPAMQYELWVAKDKEFNDISLKEVITPDNIRVPSWTLPSGTALQTGKTYYWKVRVARAATNETGDGQWSEAMSFSVASPSAAGESAHSGPILATPQNNATNTNRVPYFSWVPISGATEYELTLAKDASLTQTVAKTKVSQASYKHNAKLEPGTTYFWQVKATKPFLSKPSSIFSFTTKLNGITGPLSKVTSIPLWLIVSISLLIVALLIIIPVVVSSRRTKQW